MKNLTIYFLLVVALFSTITFSQSQSSFNRGFNNGFKETLAEEGYNGNYFNYSNPNNCYSQFSSNQNNTYSEGYRCGVKQATIALPKIKKSDKSNYAQSNNQDIRRKSVVRQQNGVVDSNEKNRQYLQDLQKQNQRINNEALQVNTQQRNIRQGYNQYTPANFGKYVPIDVNMVQYALSYKSSNSKSNNNTSDYYSRRKKWVENMAYPNAKKYLKIGRLEDKQLLKNTKKNRDIIRNKTPIKELKSLSDGWYTAYYERKIKIDGKHEKVLSKRYVEIKSGEILNFIGARNLIYSVNYFAPNKYISPTNSFRLSIKYPDGEISKNFHLRIYDKCSEKDLPLFKEPKLLMFYSKNITHGGQTIITIMGKTDVYTRAFDKTLEGTPSCNQKEGVAKFWLGTGNYSFYGYNDLNFHKGEITIKASDTCIAMELSKSK